MAGAVGVARRSPDGEAHELVARSLEQLEMIGEIISYEGAPDEGFHSSRPGHAAGQQRSRSIP